MADIHTEEITYTGNAIEMKGYIAWDSNKGGSRPGVLVAHERWGCNEYVQLPGAVHGFSKPLATSNGQKYGLPLAYNALVDESSWAHLLLTFEDVFKEQ